MTLCRVHTVTGVTEWRYLHDVFLRQYMNAVYITHWPADIYIEYRLDWIVIGTHAARNLLDCHNQGMFSGRKDEIHVKSTWN